MITKKSRVTTKRKIILAITIIFIVALGIIGYLWLSHQSAGGSVTTTSKEPSAQSNFTSGGQREVVQSNRNEGIVTDTGGNVPSLPPSSGWSSSTSGIITVYSPAKNSLLSTGQTLLGESSADRVSFRIIDSVSGVIAQGSIGVVNGKFSGNFSFETSAQEGRLDIFTVNNSGVESNVIEIPVRFNQ
jgi:hypothetical protein